MLKKAVLITVPGLQRTISGREDAPKKLMLRCARDTTGTYFWTGPKLILRGEWHEGSSENRLRLSLFIHGVLKIVFTDDYEGVVDLRPIITRGRILTWLQKPENFQKVQLEQYGHHVFWVDDNGQELDFGADSLGRDAEKQAELHKLAAS